MRVVVGIMRVLRLRLIVGRSMDVAYLETVDLDGLGIKLEAFLLVHEELLDILALVALELDHLAHLAVGDDGAIAGELLLDHLEDLLLVELLRETLDRGQRLTTIAFCAAATLAVLVDDGRRGRQGEGLTLDTDMDVVLACGLDLTGRVFGFRERIEGLEVLDVCGHESGWAVSAGAS